MSKKIKLFILTSSLLITNTVIASLLTSCSTKNTINDICGCDKKYGITMATYNRMESDFKDLYETQQSINKDKGIISEQEYHANLLNFKSRLNSFHATLFNKDNKFLSYTIRTNTLKDFANDSYGIKLSRVTNVNLNDELTEIKDSMMSSLLICIKDYSIDSDTAAEMLANADAQFGEFKKEAIKEFGYDDIVSIIQYVQEHMISCFANITEEMDAIITQKQLKEFLNEYEINVKDNLNEQYYWDKIHGKYGVGNKEIELDDFNNIFTISPKSGPLQNNDALPLQKNLDNNLIPGYTLKPILHHMNANSYTNTYSIDVDYTLVNNHYVGKENEAKLTAHSSQLKDKSMYEDEDVSIFDLNASKEEREYTNYQLPITKEFEEQQINNTYLNNKDFTFSWSTSNEYGFDDFWTDPDSNKGNLNVSSLAFSGMMINGVLLHDIIDQAEKLSLSGGSYELKGIEKVQNKDNKQWKLSVDGEEIDGNDVQWQLISTNATVLPDFIKISNGIVSWIDEIIAGVYEFYVLASYKGTKIKTPLITLDISSIESKNVENFNHTTKNILHDENIIDQKLIDFVNNVSFSLDYTEIDYDIVDEKNNKGEVKVDNFNISYKNSKNIFEASNLFNQNISNEINEQSGITQRWSNNLFNTMKNNYDNVLGLINNDDLIEDSNNIKDDFNSLLTLSIVNSSILTFLFIAFIVVLIFSYILDDGWFVRLPGLILLLIVQIACLAVSITLLISSIIHYVNEFDDLNKNIEKIGSNSDEYTLIRNVKNDADIFSNIEKFNEFFKFVYDVKVKKFYYENNYKNDWIEYAGGVSNLNILKNVCEDLCDTQKWYQFIWILDLIALVELPFIISLFCSVLVRYNTVKGIDPNDYNALLDARGNFYDWQDNHPFINKFTMIFRLLQMKFLLKLNLN